MKTWFTKILGIGAVALALTACEKDEDRAVISSNGGPTLTASSTALGALSADNAAKEAVVFNWTNADYGYPAAVTYTLQLDVKGNNFKSPSEFTTTATKRAFTVAELNSTLLALGIAPGSTGQLDARVLSNVSSNTTYAQQSGVTSVTAMPYLSIIAYPSLYVPGKYQDWAPEKAPKIASPANNGTYEGYVNFTDPNGFKFTSAPNWDNTNYGISGTITTDPATEEVSGKLSSTGGDISLPATGYYRLIVNVPNLTWTATPTTWAAIGSATPGGWDNQTPLTYNTATGTWSATMNLSAGGEVKFRANNKWDINYGDTKADGVLDAGGDNIKGPTAAGSYLVTLDLSQGAGNYTYSIRKN
ncbi:SusF/SusE family outer membrane protein [Hymenobacter sp. NBH84]|uniref:SusE domain-containing protein n=1 Tax=Hymenobacter sp. NBH84 TaxID=2596915 RepID=UPI001629FAC6|nr:SusE domain-containing protein [Hymenobacter sp. NBH84]QNE41722.1 SusF/SusE family outer membrane protein [Hymenobacter sp. NBH84]